MSTTQKSKPTSSGHPHEARESRNAGLTALPAWGKLTDHHRAMADISLRELFAADPTRGERLTT